MAIWSDYIAYFKTDFQEIAGSFETDLSITYTAFAAYNRGQVGAALDAYDNQATFITGLASLLETAGDNAGLTDDPWISLSESLVDGGINPFQFILSNLEADYSFAEFDELNATALSDLIVEYGSAENWNPFIDLLFLRNLQILSLYDQYATLFSTNYSTSIADFITETIGTGPGLGITDFRDFAEYSSDSLFVELSTGFGTYKSSFAQDILNAATAFHGEYSGPTADEYDEFVNSFNEDDRISVRALMTIYDEENSGDFTVLTGSTASAIKLKFTDDTIYDLAQWLIFKAQAYIEGYGISNKAIIQVANVATSAGISGLEVEVYDDVFGTETSKLVAREVTNEQGYIKLSFMSLRTIYDDYELTVIVKNGDTEEHNDTETIALNTPAIALVIDLTVTAASSSSSLITAVKTALSLTFSTELQTYINENTLETLNDIREIGGLGNQTDVEYQLDEVAVLKLDSQASLEILQQDITANSSLYTAGYTNLASIAKTDKTKFIADVSTSLGKFEGGRVHAVATSTDKTISNVIMTSRVSVDTLGGETDSRHVDSDSCKCSDCQAATSPLAYLADLLNYTINHVSYDNGSILAPITLAQIQSTFHQQFNLLPATCSEMENLICQTRIAVEIMRSYKASLTLTTPQTTAFEAAHVDFLTKVYFNLLENIGSSYNEIRLSEHWSSEKRIELAKRMGITLTGNPDQLNTLLIDLTQSAVDIEKDLQDIFGYKDTIPANVFTAVNGSDYEDWRMANIRGIWSEQDFRKNIYNEREELLIDPDLIGPDDFRDPDASTTSNTHPFHHWKKRRENIITWQGLIEAKLTVLGKKKGVYPQKRTVALKDIDLVSKFIQTDKAFIIGSASGSSIDGGYEVESVKNEGQISHLTLAGITLIHSDDYGNLWSAMPVDISGTSAVTSAVYEGDRTGDFTVSSSLKYYTETGGYQGATVATSVFSSGETTVTFSSISVSDDFIYFQLNDIGEIGLEEYDDFTKVLTDFAGITFTDYLAKTIVPWNGSTTLNDFDDVLEDILKGVDVSTELSDLSLTKESFTRLMEIYNKQLLSLSNYEKEEVTEKESTEFVDILLSAVKSKGKADWITEENTRSLKQSNQAFWISLTEPTIGTWESDASPLIDPTVLDKKELGDSELAVAAKGLFDTRVASLSTELATIETEHDTSFEDMMDHVYPSSVTTNFASWYSGGGSTWVIKLQALILNFRSDNIEDKAIAIAAYTDDLLMGEEDFTSFIEILEKDIQTNPDNKPTREDWDLVYSILLVCFKKNDLWTAPWITAETSAGTNYWNSLKAKLPKWRANIGDRVKWQMALNELRKPANIDPDLIYPSDLKNPTSGTAFALWKARDLEIHEYNTSGVLTDGMLFDLKTLRESDTSPLLDGFKLIIKDALYLQDASYFVGIKNDQEAGLSSKKKLNQLQLSYSEFDLLYTYYDLVDNSTVLTATEWDEVYKTLCRAKKRFLAQTWREQEETNDVTLSGDNFIIPELPPIEFPPVEFHKLDPLLADNRAYRKWQRTVKARLAQVDSILASIKDSNEEADEKFTKGFRDAIIDIVRTESNYYDKAEWVLDNLLFDAKNNCCQKTTRISQAIECLQLLNWKLKLDHLQTTYPQLDIDASTFDKEWKWIGSYATWRSAIFVHIYPENILIPALKRYKSEPFKQLLKATRGNAQLGDNKICTITNDFYEYFEDVNNMDIWGTVRSYVTPKGSPCKPEAGSSKYYTFLFGKSKKRNRYYWCKHEPSKGSNQNQEWFHIKRLDGAVSTIGAVQHNEDKDGKYTPYIHLFVNVPKGYAEGISFTRMNTNTAEFDELQDVEMQGATKYHAVLQNTNVRTAPIVYYYDETKQIAYFASMNWFGDSIANVGELKLVNSNKIDFAKKPKFKLLDAFRWYGSPRCVLYEFEDTDDDFLIGTWSYQGGKDSPSANILKIVRSLPTKHEQIPHNEYLGCHFDKNLLTLRFKGLPFGTGNQLQIILSPGGADKIPVHREGWYGGQAYYGKWIPNNGPYNYKGGERTCIYHNSKPEIRTMKRRRFPAPSYLYYYVFQGPVYNPVASIKTNYYLKPSYNEDMTGMLQAMRSNNKNLFIGTNSSLPENLKELVREAYYFVPIQIASKLTRQGDYEKALSWYRLVYDYTQENKIVGGRNLRKIYAGLHDEENFSALYNRMDGWLEDPMNPHEIARTRANTYTKFTILTIAKTILAYADAEYTFDTIESVPRARELYRMAHDLVDLLSPPKESCDQKIGAINITVGKAWIETWYTWATEMAGINNPATLATTITSIETEFAASKSDEAKMLAIRAIITASLPSDTALTIGARIQADSIALNKSQMQLMATESTRLAFAEIQENASASYITAVSEVSGLPEANLSANNPDLLWLADDAASNANFADLPLNRQWEVFNDPTDIQYSGINGDSIMDSPATFLGSRQTNYRYFPNPNVSYCIPPNPIVRTLILKSDMNLFKIRNCRNIAGIERQLDAFAAPTDTTSGMPVIGPGGTLSVPGNIRYKPTPYKYHVLVDRAKSLVQMANQLESAMLSALEKKDSESYNYMKAKQDLKTAKANVKLQELKIKESEEGLKLAQLQTAKSEFQAGHFEDLIAGGLNGYEQGALDMLNDVARIQNAISGMYTGLAAVHMAMTISAGIAAVAAQTAEAGGAAVGLYAGSKTLLNTAYSSGFRGIETGISALSAQSSRQSALSSHSSTMGSYVRRSQEWAFQKEMAGHDVGIGKQQEKIASSRIKINTQEKSIAELQTNHAEDTVEFLKTKFTNAALYEWMGEVLEENYRYMLQEATAMAQLAVGQLAFEKQLTPPDFIKSDYWEVPANPGAEGESPDRKGLTGSTRLLADLTKLDQFAFSEDKQKLMIRKTISLSKMAPIEFKEFKETGVLTFGTPMEMFDRDYPGHYLRLIQSVDVAVVALIPPSSGIRATLTSSGTSRVVIKGDLFTQTSIKRSPEVVAFSAAQGNQGIFPMQPDNQMLKAFEGTGVDTLWEFRMEKAANQFNFDSIADVVVNIDYAALQDFDYKMIVSRQLDPALSAMQPYSMRNNFPDQWYELLNPGTSNTPMEVKFSTFRGEFPPNMSEVMIENVAVLFATDSDEKFEVLGKLTYANQTIPQLGGSFKTDEKVVSTNKANGGALLPIVGQTVHAEWTLKFSQNDARLKERFTDGEITDIILVVSYNGEVPAMGVIES